MNAIAARFQRRNDSAAKHEPPIERRPEDCPETLDFLNRHAELVHTVDRQRTQLERQAMELTLAGERMDYLAHELLKAQHDRDQYAKGYFFLKANMSVIGSTTVAATKHVNEVVGRAIEQAEGEMLRSGVTPEIDARAAAALEAAITGQTGDGNGGADDGAAAMGRKFGANGAHHETAAGA